MYFCVSQHQTHHGFKLFEGHTQLKHLVKLWTFHTILLRAYWQYAAVQSYIT